MLSYLLPRRRATFVADDEKYWHPVGMSGAKTRAGVNVDPEIALTYSAVFLCTRIIAEPIASMPIRIYQRAENGDRKLATDAASQKLTELLSIAPNADQTAMPFRDGRTAQQVNYGNAFAEIVLDGRGNLAELWPIHASRVSRPQPDSGYDYAIRNDNGTVIGMRRDELLHICGVMPDDGICGRGVIQYARESIGFGIATERHGGAYFGSGAQPKGIVITPGLKQREDRRQFRAEWKEIHASPESSEVVILPPESSYSPITVSNADNQFLESRRFNRVEICNWYRVPIYMLGETTARGNIEQMGAEFIMYTLAPWARRWEEQLSLKLLSRERWTTHAIEHDFSALLRGDITSRMNAYRVGITTGIYTINQCRRLENMEGIGPAGDVNYVPANMYTAERMMQEGSSAGAGGPGSDHTGAPADSPLDRRNVPDDPQQAFDQWTRRGVGNGVLTHAERQELLGQTTTMERRLEQRPIEWLEVARECVHDVLSRMLNKESQAAQRAADGKGDFDAWLKDFYAKHHGLLADALRPACSTLRLAGVSRWSDRMDLASWLVEQSRRELQASYSRDSHEVFARRLAAWPTERAAELTERLLRGET